MDLYIRGLGKAFGGTVVLEPTDFTVRQGTFTTLLGPSGCGKTTLLRMIAGLETPDTGTISIGGQELFAGRGKKEVPPHRRGFGMVFQDFALWPHMTVFENVAFGLRAGRRSSDIRRTVMEALEKVRLGGMEERYPHQLSGGQQQRVAFARAVAVSPRLVLFDEPLSALDAVLREEMRLEMLSLVRKMGLTALYVTHDQIEAMSMSDEIIVMNAGRVLQSGTPEEVYGKPRQPFVARFIGRANWLAPDREMFRPEHLQWQPGDEFGRAYKVRVTHVSYMGDRYELKVRAEGMEEEWTAYCQWRPEVECELKVYLPEHRIHRMDVSLLKGEK